MLRHAIVRLKIQTSGNGDETLPNLVNRLAGSRGSAEEVSASKVNIQKLCKQ